MAMTVIWTGMVVVSILCGLATGNGPAVAGAAMGGAAAAGGLGLSTAGGVRLWAGPYLTLPAPEALPTSPFRVLLV